MGWREQQAVPAFSIFTVKDDLWPYRRHLASRAQHSLLWSRVYYCSNQIGEIRQNCENLTTFTCQHTLAFSCSLSQMDLFPSNLSFWCIWVFFSFLFYRTGTARGTPPTQTLPSVSRTQCWCGSLVSICGCWLPSTAFISTAMTMDAFRCLASAPPKWWDFTWRLWPKFSLRDAFSFEKKNNL